MRNRSSQRLRAQAGFTLIEALSSVLIMSVGLLGVAALQSRSLADSFGAAARSQAVIAAGDMAVRLRANPVDYSTVQPADHECRQVHFAHVHAARECSALELAADDLQDWRTRIAGTLPVGAGTVRRQGQHYVVEVSWDERNGESANPLRQRTVTVLRP